MKKLSLFVLALVAVPLFAMAAAEAPEAPMEEALEIAEAPAMTVEAPEATSFEEDVVFESLVYQSLGGGQCIDSGQACGPRGSCDAVCGTLSCDCINGTCQYCG